MRSVTSHYHGSKIFCISTKGSLGNNDGDGNENGKKTNKIILVKHQLCTCITIFCTFFSHHCTTAT